MEKQNFEELVKTLNKLTEEFNIGDKVITTEGKVGIITRFDPVAEQYFVNTGNSEVDYFEDELTKYDANLRKIFAVLRYDGNVVNEYAIENFIGTKIPENFDKNKFSLEIEII